MRLPGGRNELNGLSVAAGDRHLCAPVTFELLQCDRQRLDGCCQLVEPQLVIGNHRRLNVDAQAVVFGIGLSKRLALPQSLLAYALVLMLERRTITSNVQAHDPPKDVSSSVEAHRTRDRLVERVDARIRPSHEFEAVRALCVNSKGNACFLGLSELLSQRPGRGAQLPPLRPPRQGAHPLRLPVLRRVSLALLGRASAPIWNRGAPHAAGSARCATSVASRARLVAVSPGLDLASAERRCRWGTGPATGGHGPAWSSSSPWGQWPAGPGGRPLGRGRQPVDSAPTALRAGRARP